MNFKFKLQLRVLLTAVKVTTQDFLKVVKKDSVVNFLTVGTTFLFVLTAQKRGFLLYVYRNVGTKRPSILVYFFITIQNFQWTELWKTIWSGLSKREQKPPCLLFFTFQCVKVFTQKCLILRSTVRFFKQPLAFDLMLI